MSKTVEDHLFNQGLGKIPPQNQEIEEIILGALMFEKDAISKVVDRLEPESFYSDAHREIYRAITMLFNKSEPIDMSMVVSQLRKNGKLEFIGGSYYIAELTNKVARGANIEFHAMEIIEMATKREMIALASEIMRDAYEDTTDVIDLVTGAYQKINTITGKQQKKKPKYLSESVGIVLDGIDHNIENKVKMLGVPTGFVLLDKVIGGWMPTDLIILASRPGMGKTSFMLTSARYAATHNIVTAVISLEMSNGQLTMKLISIESDVPLEKIRRSDFKKGQFKSMVEKIEKLKTESFIIDDPATLNVNGLRAKVAILVGMGVKQIFVDYLQLMDGSYKKGGREQEISEISRTLKACAKEYGIPIIALSQLSRALESRADKRPQLSDLRESGAIEQDADIVIFLYRPEYYKIKQTASGKSTEGQCEVIIAKHRNGKLEDFTVSFIAKTTKFVDYVHPELKKGETKELPF